MLYIYSIPSAIRQTLHSEELPVPVFNGFVSEDEESEHDDFNDELK